MKNQVWLYRFILNIRPAPLSVLLKKALKISRVEHVSSFGTFYLDPCSNFGFELLATGKYEPQLLKSFEKLLEDGSVCLDIGANEGFFSVLASRLVNDSGLVIAVEPQPRLEEILRRNFELNQSHNVSLETIAISNDDGVACLNITPDINTGASGFTKMTKYALDTQSVKTLRLENLLEKYSLNHVDLMKVDVEGHEYEVILGSQEVFRKHIIKNIALELHPTILAHRKLNASDITDFLLDAGYSVNSSFSSLVFTANSH